MRLRRAVLKTLRLCGVVLVVTLGSFLLLQLVPGDPVVAALGDSATPEQYAAAREALGLERPLPERYVEWLTGMLTGDFGQSLVPPAQEVGDLVLSRLPVTVELAVLAMVLTLLVSVPLGMWTAHERGRPVDIAVSGGAFVLLALPTFLIALLLIFFVIFNTAVLKALLVAGAIMAGLVTVVAPRRRPRLREGGWATVRAIAPVLAVVLVAIALVAWMPMFPRHGFDRLTSAGLVSNLRSAFLPALTLALAEAPVFLRVLRNDMIVTLEEDYVLAAKAKGLPDWSVLTRHALRPASLSLITVAGVSFGRLLGGTVIVEAVYGVPGMGSLVIRAIQTNDYPVVQASIVVLATLYVVVNALVDVSYAYLDPRLRSRGG